MTLQHWQGLTTEVTDTMDHEEVIKRYDKALTLLEEFVDIASVKGPDHVKVEKMNASDIYHCPADDTDRWIVIIPKETHETDSF